MKLTEIKKDFYIDSRQYKKGYDLTNISHFIKMPYRRISIFPLYLNLISY